MLPAAPRLPAARPGVLASPVRQFPARDGLAEIVRDLARASALEPAVARLQHQLREQLRLTDAMCVWIDWPQRRANSLSGPLSGAVQELVLSVAGSGRRTTFGSALLEPLGSPPARVLLALRRAPGAAFEASERGAIGRLAAEITPLLDRLIAGHTRR